MQRVLTKILSFHYKKNGTVAIGKEQKNYLTSKGSYKLFVRKPIP